MLIVPLEKQKARRVLAAFFLLFMLAEWGSHGLMCPEVNTPERSSVTIDPNGHEDPCDTLILCSDGKQKDRQMPSFSHDSAQHNAIFDRSIGIRTEVVVTKDRPIPLASSSRLFRPIDPPFHPPEFS